MPNKIRTFTIDGKPVAKARPRFSRKSGRVYTPQSTFDYEQLVMWSYMDLHQGVCRGPIWLTLIFHIKIPQSYPKWKKAKMLSGEILPTGKPDIDNLAKTVMDGLNKVAYEDDSKVVMLTCQKVYGLTDKVEVSLWYQSEV
jgi:Holliday junction resolvase RusA-like endonuclease